MYARDHGRGLERTVRKALGGVALFGVLAALGCDSLLDVELPGSTTADALDNPGSAGLLVLSAEKDFECAYSN